MCTWKYGISFAESTPLTAPLPLDGDLYQAIKKAAKLGYDAVEVHTRESFSFDFQRLEQMKEAVIDGVDLIGYTMWGFIDIVSCGSMEMSKRYGVIYVDQDDAGHGTLARSKKDSFYWYQKCIRSNGEDLA